MDSHATTTATPTGRELIDQSVQLKELVNHETGEVIAWRTNKLRRALDIIFDTIPDEDLLVLAQRGIEVYPLEAMGIVLELEQPPIASAIVAPPYANGDRLPMRNCAVWLVALGLQYDQEPLFVVIEALSHELAHVYLMHDGTDPAASKRAQEYEVVRLQVRWGFARLVLEAIDAFAIRGDRWPAAELARLRQEVVALAREADQR